MLRQPSALNPVLTHFPNGRIIRASESVRSEGVMRSRVTAALDARLERNLVAYAMTASAAGIGVVALSQSAEAKVIYTPAHIAIGMNGYSLDVNHDGITDFKFVESTGCSLSSCYNTMRVAGGVIITQRSLYAAALRRGAKIGSKKVFSFGYARLLSVFSSSSKTYARGPWVNVKKRYLGLEFKVKGETHFGWARLNVHVYGHQINTTLTGYAYETKPYTPIIADNRGSTTGAGPDVPGEPASLGHLALGASGRNQPVTMTRGH